MRFYNQEKALLKWESFLQEERPLTRRLLGAILIGSIGLGLDEAAYLLTLHYFSALPVATAALIAVYSGYRIALAAGVVLALIADYLFLPPTGSVLDSAAGYVHLFSIVILTILMCMMVTAFRLALSRMRQARRSAEQAKIEMERVLSVVSHDLRNPIAVARAGAETLLLFNAGAERTKELENRIVEAMDRADAMIRDLLDAHHLQKGSDPEKNLDLRQLADQLIQEFSLIHGDRFVLESDAKVQGRWSLLDLRRVIENLVGNAVKYGASDKKITLRIEQDEKVVRISVHNFGVPVSAEVQSQLLNGYHSSERASSASGKGWGIGLMSVSRIVESYGGKISVESDQERGTRFTVYLPKVV